MAYVTVLKSIAFIIFSIGIGFVYYYTISSEQHTVKKKQLDEAVSLLINFVLFIWLGKVIADLSLFLTDPVAVLAYPSNANAFYIATLCIIINLIYKYRRAHIDLVQSTYLFLALLLASTFTYEFFQWMINSVKHNRLLLLFITVLLIVFTLVKHVNKSFLIMFTYILLIGLFIISFISPLMTFFGYILAPTYFLLLSVMYSLFVYRQKRKV